MDAAERAHFNTLNGHDIDNLASISRRYDRNYHKHAPKLTAYFNETRATVK